MPNLLEMLAAKDEAEAALRIRTLAAAPVSVTLVGTASGCFFMTSTGEPPVEIVEHLLLEALKECAHMKVHQEHKHETPT